MAEEGTPIAETPKKVAKAASKAKKPKPAASHPKISMMVNAAIINLKERGGSSLQAIKKYVGSNYKVDMERLAPFIKKYLKSAVATGELVQTKGKGASGSFKLKGKAEGNHPKMVKTAKKTKPAAPAEKAAKKTSVKKVTKKPKAEKKSKPAKSPKKPKVKAVAAKPKAKPKKASKAPSRKAAARKGRK